MLVIACNSASSACLRDARERYDVPVVEVIQPAVRRAVAATRNGRVGLLATAVTVQSRAYDDAFAAAPQVDADQRGLPALRRLRRARASPPVGSCCSWPRTTSTRCCGPTSTPSCSAARTTRC